MVERVDTTRPQGAEPQKPLPRSHTPDWLKGMAYSFGGCVFLVVMSIIFVLVMGFLIAGCMAMAPPPSG